MTEDIRNTIKKKLRLEGTSLLGVLQIITTFSLVAFALIFFRANSISDALYISRNLFRDSASWANSDYLYGLMGSMGLSRLEFSLGLASVVLLFLGEILAREKPVYQLLNERSFFISAPFYLGLITIILTMGVYYGTSEFIYFQF